MPVVSFGQYARDGCYKTLFVATGVPDAHGVNKIRRTLID